MYPALVIVRLLPPASLAFADGAPDRLRFGQILARSGFAPLGIPELLVNSSTDEWVGVLYWASAANAEAFMSNNPGIDKSLLCTVEIGTSRLFDYLTDAQRASMTDEKALLLTWARSDKMRVFAANEVIDSWYAQEPARSELINPESLRSPSQSFLAVAIDTGPALRDFSLNWPKKMTIPTVAFGT
jgi:hypothetical protein